MIDNDEIKNVNTLIIIKKVIYIALIQHLIKGLYKIN